MAQRKPTFGQAIATLRRNRPMTQKELAQKVLRTDGKAISAQYLNDIEHDRRSPSGDHLIEQFAKALGTDAHLLSFIAGTLPPPIRDLDLDADALKRAMEAFRKAADDAKRPAADRSKRARKA